MPLVAIKLTIVQKTSASFGAHHQGKPVYKGGDESIAGGTFNKFFVNARGVLIIIIPLYVKEFITACIAL